MKMAEKKNTTLIVTLPSDREIVMTRIFNAPRQLVFEASTKCEHMVHWWGPRGYTLPVCEIDLRPGGHYRLVNRGPDGKDHPFKGVYREIAPPERLVHTFIYDVEGWSDNEVLVTVTLEEHNGLTKLTSRSLFRTIEDRDAYLKSGMEEGAAETYDRLAEHLESVSAAPKPAEPELVITRVFDGPRELVFKAWTEPERFMRWWGPKNFTTPFCKIDLRPGGAWHFCMRSPEGQDFWGKGIYREVVEPERTVSIFFLSDEAGNRVDPTRYGMDPDFPSEILMTVTFAEHDGKTKLTLHQTIPESVAKRQGAYEGWNQSFDKLADYLRA